jgi:hypothetical protein
MAKNEKMIIVGVILSGVLAFSSIIAVCEFERMRFKKAYRDLTASPTIELARQLFTGVSMTFVNPDTDELRFRGLKDTPANVNLKEHHVLYVTWTGMPQQRVFVFYEPERSNVVAVGHAKW